MEAGQTASESAYPYRPKGNPVWTPSASTAKGPSPIPIVASDAANQRTNAPCACLSPSVPREATGEGDTVVIRITINNEVAIW